MMIKKYVADMGERPIISVSGMTFMKTVEDRAKLKLLRQSNLALKRKEYGNALAKKALNPTDCRLVS